MRERLALLAVVSVAVAAPAAAQDEALPSLEFLEYLGSWDEGDEEWLVVAEEFMGQPQAGDEDMTVIDGDDDSAARNEEAREDETDDNDED